MAWWRIFISKSETKLNEFLNKMPSIETRKKVLSLIDEIAEEAILLYSNKSIVNGGGQQ